MKKLLLALPLVALTGCMSPDFTRLIPENKDADISIIHPYGHIVIRSRVNPQGTNALPGLDNSKPITP